MLGNSTRKRRSRKTADRPKMPHQGFPLYAHPLGYWSKKVDGRLLHFGRWGRVVKGKLERLPYEDSWRAALDLFNARNADARNGEIVEVVVQPAPNCDESDDGELRIDDLLNRFLTAKQRKVESGELAPRSFGEYKEATDLIVTKFGKTKHVINLTPFDFEELRAVMAKRWGPARLRKFIILIRAAFRYADKNGLIDHPVKFGSEFLPPGQRVRRRHRAARDKKLFTREEVLTILDALDGREVAVVGNRARKSPKFKAAPNLKQRAAVLLGVNAGLGNGDIAALQRSHIDLSNGWLVYPRPKTGFPPHRARLGEEAAEKFLAARPRRIGYAANQSDDGRLLDTMKNWLTLMRFR